MIRKTKYLILAIFFTFCSQQADPVNQENQASEEVTTTQVENEESNDTSSTVEVEQIEKFQCLKVFTTQVLSTSSLRLHLTSCHVSTSLRVSEL